MKENIIKEVVSDILSSLSLSNLEKQYDVIKKKLKTKKVVDLSLKELKPLLAYEFLKDGAEPDFAKEIINDKNPSYNNKIDLLKQLEIFGY
jgi:hypothetical protein